MIQDISGINHRHGAGEDKLSIINRSPRLRLAMTIYRTGTVCVLHGSGMHGTREIEGMNNRW